MVFAITDQFRKRNIFGIEIVSESPTNLRLNIFWTEEDQQQSQIGQSWDIPTKVGDWTRLSIGVRGDTASLYTGCSNVITKQFIRKNKEMKIESNYIFYLAKGDLYSRNYQVK